jgi:hypothetical protein
MKELRQQASLGTFYAVNDMDDYLFRYHSTAPIKHGTAYLVHIIILSVFLILLQNHQRI